jgi:hypothetical protein
MITGKVTLLAIGYMAMLLVASGQRSNGPQAVPMGYELYSWKESGGNWTFSLLPSPSGVNVTPEEVFNKKFLLSGAQELKRKISGLPAESTIYWLNRTSGTGKQGKGSKKLSYPSAETVKEIRAYAEAHKIKVELLSGEQNGTDSKQ